MSLLQGSSDPVTDSSSCICLLTLGDSFTTQPLLGEDPKALYWLASNRMQIPALGHQTLHGVNADHLIPPSFHTLTVIPSVPRH